jgi:hypothetical protein
LNVPISTGTPRTSPTSGTGGRWLLDIVGGPYRVAHAPDSTVILGVVSAAATPQPDRGDPPAARRRDRRDQPLRRAWRRWPGRLAESRRPAARA